MSGVCHVVSGFWEVIPVSVIKSFLKRFIKDLSRDTAAINTRVATIQVSYVTLQGTDAVLHLFNFNQLIN